jgi:hypothetical protein
MLAVSRERKPPKLRPSELSDVSIELASLPLKRQGLVLDYTLTSGDLVVLEAAQSYLVTSDIIATNLVIEGLAVVRFATNTSIEVSIDGGVTCLTEAYRPAYFIAEDDDLGAFGTNTSASYYASTALILHDGNHLLRHLRFSHALNAISLDGGDLTVEHCLFTRCGTVFDLTGADVYLNNGLIWSVTNVVSGSAYPEFHAQHLTLHEAEVLLDNTDQTGTASLTNSLLAELDSWGDVTPSTNCVAISADDSCFASVGGGSHYLAAGSVGDPYRNAGTTNIAADLAAELRQRTTDPPLLLSDPITLDTTLTRQARRDYDLPDLGFHPPPLDYLLDIVQITNAVVTIKGGVVLASYNHAGFWCADNSTLISEGTATLPNVLTRYYTVQEATSDRGPVSGTTTISPYHYGTSPATVRLRFTDSTIPAFGGYPIYLYEGNWAVSALEVKDCRWFGGELWVFGTNSLVTGLTNNLFHGVLWSDDSTSKPVNARNNLLLRGPGLFTPTTSAFVFNDNLLDGSTLYNVSASLTHDHNAFYQSTNFYSTFGTNANEQILATLNYESWLDWDFYQPTNSSLIDAGSTNAHLLGLYHYTTTSGTNQLKETNGMVDIGIHAVALNGEGKPVDSDGDGIFDYIEDSNGNGQHDTGETDWEMYDSQLGIGSGPGLILFTPLKP